MRAPVSTENVLHPFCWTMNENRLLFDKQKALKRIEELEGEQIKTARREMVLAVVGTMKAGKSTTINAIVMKPTDFCN
jgi:replication fork clamp-binding protein CrfC